MIVLAAAAAASLIPSAPAWVSTVLVTSPEISSTAPTASSSARASAAFCQADRNALVRVALAESGAEGDSGIAAVVLVIRNRLTSGRFGTTLDAVLNAPRQFEPVWRRGSSSALPAPTPSQRSRLETIINLICDGRVPDFTHGSVYFQNTAIVRARVLQGQASPSLIAFGNPSATAVVGRHSFYQAFRRAGAGKPVDRPWRSTPTAPSPAVDIFYGADSKDPGLGFRRGEERSPLEGDR